MSRLLYFFILVNLLSCTTTENVIKSSSITKARLKASLNNNSMQYKIPDVNFFNQEGPYRIKLYVDEKLFVNNKLSLVSDIILTKRKGQNPLVIIQHGNKSRKEAHRFQGLGLASWGFNVIILQQINTYNWLTNANNITKLVKKLPKIKKLSKLKINYDQTILVGHSFGGSAVSIAATKLANVIGIILLDPAIVANRVIKLLPQITQPVLLLGSDKKIFKTKKRSSFYTNITSEFKEVSVVGATHDDAQYPSMFSIYSNGVDPYTNTKIQSRFLAALTSATYSLRRTGDFSYAWTSYNTYINRGFLKNAKSKN